MQEPKQMYCRLYCNNAINNKCSEQCQDCKEATAEELLKKNFLIEPK